MAYRYCASGVLEVSPRYVDRVCSILNSQSIRYEREGNTVTIKHDEKAVTPNRQRPEEQFSDLARYIETPQALTVYSELEGESEVGFIDGKVRTDTVSKVWATGGEAPTQADELRSVPQLLHRGLAEIAQLHLQIAGAEGHVEVGVDAEETHPRLVAMHPTPTARKRPRPRDG